MIVVTGATGQLGAGIVEHLLTRLPAEQIGVSVRDPQKAQSFADRGVRVRAGSFTDPDSLAAAFEGASQVLIVSVDAIGEAALAQHATAIQAAARAGAGRILYTSHQGANPTSHFHPAVDHAATEELLAASGVPYTSLRNGFYSASAMHLAGAGLASGTIVVPQDGRVSWTSRGDLAEAAAAVLGDEGRFEGPTPPLTAAEAVDFAAIAESASRVTGRAITSRVVPDEDYVASMVEHGAPEPMARMLLGAFLASRAGEFDVVDPALGELLGRTPTSVEDLLRSEVGGSGV